MTVNNEKRINLKVEDLETRLDYPHYFENQIEIETEEKKVVYYGKVFWIHYNYGNLEGAALLRRYDSKIVSKQESKLISWFPPKWEVKEVKVAKPQLKLIWEIGTRCGSDYHDGYNITFLNKFITWDDNIGYKYKLLTEAANQHLKLSRKLLEMVFDPIDIELKKIYNLARESWELQEQYKK